MTAPAYVEPIRVTLELGVVDYHPRSHWMDPALPINGDNWIARLIDMMVGHYTAAVDLPDGDPDEHQTDRDIAPYLRRIQADYEHSRGYAVGYWWAIDWLGGVWQLRGFDLVTGLGGYKSAANAGHNDHTAPVLFLVDGNDAPTPAARRAFRCLNRATRTHPYRGRRTQLAVIDHGRLPGAATQCAGTGIRRVIDAGELGDEYTDHQPPPDTGDDDDMDTSYLWQHPDFLNVWLCGAGAADHQTPATVALLKSRGVTVVVEAHAQKLKQCLVQSGLELSDLAPAGPR